ncbi:MAG: RHS repeat-associated core domain-containing protein, partial [Prevotellaceae bacterium]|nr:RHS repeat-associated core domain-containing protein [Prevotellaceae bacterium]
MDLSYHAKGRLTGTATAILDDAGTTSYLYTVFYYDKQGRVIQTKSTNQFTGGYDKEYFVYDFTGQVTQHKHIHSNGSTTTTEEYTYVYDHAGRLLFTKHKLNNGSEQTLLANTYDDLGRLKENSRNGVASLKTNYTYNIRSWLKTITGSLFNG